MRRLALSLLALLVPAGTLAVGFDLVPMGPLYSADADLRVAVCKKRPGAVSCRLCRVDEETGLPGDLCEPARRCEEKVIHRFAADAAFLAKERECMEAYTDEYAACSGAYGVSGPLNECLNDARRRYNECAPLPAGCQRTRVRASVWQVR